MARAIEESTAHLPSNTFLWAAGASIVGSLTLMALGNMHGLLFVGQQAPTFVLLGIYNKIVKVTGKTDDGLVYRAALRRTEFHILSLSGRPVLVVKGQLDGSR